jgi:hypothetical protein
LAGKLIHVNASLDCATRKEDTLKSGPSAAPVWMSDLLAKHLRDFLKRRYKPNPDGYLFTNSKGKPYLSDNVVKYGVHRAMSALGMQTPCGVHAGIHCFRHGVASELLESGTPIHVVTRLMRHADPNVTLKHYATSWAMPSVWPLRSFLSGSGIISTNWSHLPQLRRHGSCANSWSPQRAESHARVLEASVVIQANITISPLAMLRRLWR